MGQSFHIKFEQLFVTAKIWLQWTLDNNQKKGLSTSTLCSQTKIWMKVAMKKKNSYKKKIHKKMMNDPNNLTTNRENSYSMIAEPFCITCSLWATQIMPYHIMNVILYNRKRGKWDKCMMPYENVAIFILKKRTRRRTLANITVFICQRLSCVYCTLHLDTGVQKKNNINS